MRITETRSLFERDCEFPVDHETLAADMGSVELEAPTGDATTLGAVLDGTDATTYASADELYTTVLGNLDDAFIGRKFYDDRGGVPDGFGDADASSL